MKKIEYLAYRALIKEVELTPKPGLVDKCNNGSHKDMDIETFYKSSNAIKPFISQFLECGKKSLHVKHSELFSELRQIGLKCEKEMFAATGGVNTHKGMIFSFAVICGAIGRLKSNKKNIKSSQLQDEIKKICKNLIEKDLHVDRKAKTNGERLFKKTKFAGIRDEAQNGYPSIFKESLPFYNSKKQKFGEEVALKLTLLFMMNRVVDSNLFARGGTEGMRFTQERAGKLLEEITISTLDEKLQKFDDQMIERNLSAGGSADLLGLTWFLSNVV